MISKLPLSELSSISKSLLAELGTDTAEGVQIIGVVCSTAGSVVAVLQLLQQ